jgi:hypothetical protein
MCIPLKTEIVCYRLCCLYRAMVVRDAESYDEVPKTGEQAKAGKTG